MTELTALLAQKAEIDKQIAAQKTEAVAGILAQMSQLGITVEDLAPTRKSGGKRAVKYRDDKGNTWTGVGQRPRWVRAAMLDGATLEQFAVGKPR